LAGQPSLEAQRKRKLPRRFVAPKKNEGGLSEIHRTQMLRASARQAS
jgi:hypothetical protein